MAKILVCYYSKTNHTRQMAEAVAAGAKKVGGTEVEIKSIDQVKPKDLLDYNGIIIGSPTYYGAMAQPVKQLIDESVAYHGQLEGKVGGAFSSCGNIAGGGETTILSILQALLIHGMVVKGTSKGGHYGPVAIGSMDDRSRQECLRFGEYLAELTVKLHG